MQWFLNSPLFAGMLGFVVAAFAVTSRAFNQGGGLVLVALVLLAVLLAAIGGVITAWLPPAIAFWTARLALFLLAFAVSVWLLDR